MGRASGDTFGWALSVLKCFPGARVARKGWNGKGMWLALVRPGHMLSDLGAACRLYGLPNLAPLPWIGMRTADGCFVPWLPSQTDMLAEDWVEVAGDGAAGNGASFVRNSYIVARTGEVPFERRQDGSLVVRLDGYVICPTEQLAEVSSSGCVDPDKAALAV